MKQKRTYKKIAILIAGIMVLSSATMLTGASASSDTSATAQTETGQTPPAKPDGDSPSETGQTPPDKPDGDAANGSGKTFSDVTTNDSWAKDAIQFLSSRGIVNGTSETTYSPELAMRRGDFVLMLYHQFNWTETTDSMYSDVATDSYYYKAISAAKASGILTEEGTFSPADAITREDAMQMLYRAMKKAGKITDTDESTDVSAYSDVSDIDSSAVSAIATMTKMGVVQGFNGKFMPKKTMTRAEMAVVFYKVLDGSAQNGMGQGGTPPSGNGQSSSTTDANGNYTGGSDTGSITGTAAVSVDGETKTSDQQTISATEQNQSAVKVTNSGTYTLTNSALTKTGDTTSADESNFYGLNAAVLANGKAALTIKDTTIHTDSEGSNAVFASGEGTTIYASGLTIYTTKNSSRGLDATYGGTIIADDVNITTQGAHCGAIATDRGEGNITVTNATAQTSGEGSPGIYCTGNIKVSDSHLTATGSEAAVIEGKNSITLTNTDLSGNYRCGAMLYQSFSGDAGVGTSTFTMTGGKLTANVGPIFYITNTQSVIDLKNATLEGDGGLLTASADRWGNSGTNGGNVTLNADTQTLKGDIVCDSISSAVLNLKNDSDYTGTVNAEKTAKSITVSLDESSTWQVTGDSYVTVLTDDDTSFSNIKDNGHTIYYDATNSANRVLDGKTISLSDGGKLTPAA